MALKAHFALLAFIVCTAYTSLRPSWIWVHTSQRPVCSSQISLSVRTSQRSVCNSQKSTLLWYQSVCTSERSVHTSDLSLSPSKLKDQCALLKYWCALLKTSTAHFFSMALRTCDVSTAPFWSTTLRTHLREKLSGLTLFATGEGHIVHVADSFVCCGCIRDLEKVKFSAKIFQGFWIKKIFFSNILYLGGSGPFVSTFSEIWKMIFTKSMSKFSQQKLNLLVIYCFLVSRVTVTRNT